MAAAGARQACGRRAAGVRQAAPGVRQACGRRRHACGRRAAPRPLVSGQIDQMGLLRLTRGGLPSGRLPGPWSVVRLVRWASGA